MYTKLTHSGNPVSYVLFINESLTIALCKKSWGEKRQHSKTLKHVKKHQIA